jgi:hypothetical protein
VQRLFPQHRFRRGNQPGSVALARRRHHSSRDAPPGPRFSFASRTDQRGYIAVEWWPDDFAAILNATSRGIIVVEAAGNGAENLDDAIYQTPGAGFPANWRNSFRRTNRDSGAVVVGAGAPPPGTHGRDHGPDRSRLDFSNWGALLDAQGWGREVTSCGYGDVQGGTNEDLLYTDTFSGTSSASPIVVGVIACIQGMAKARGRPVLTPAQVRNCLRSTGSPQQDAPGRPATQRIGNRPDIRAFATCAFGKGKELARKWRRKSRRSRQGSEREGAQGSSRKEGKEVIKDKDDRGVQGRQGVQREGQERTLGRQGRRWRHQHQANRRRCRRRRHPATARCARACGTAARALHRCGLRPDLSQSALQGSSQAAKDEKDLKDAESSGGDSEGPAHCGVLRSPPKR